ncbi:hypothetical protein [Gymnodinialimonas hymeniacidonis]|uniref:hypothetical protein n=1 Tax=Gymnodinialimonas hymeniacidonis TaxID=3126508 RepID=UPI0034C63CEE
MKTIFSVLALSLLPIAAPVAAESPPVPGIPVQGLFNDPFNPLPFFEPISRTRIEVYVTDEATTCPRIWNALDCPVVVHADGTREGMVIRNYTHNGAGPVIVERIEYPSSVLATDAWPLHFVVVRE